MRILGGMVLWLRVALVMVIVALIAFAVLAGLPANVQAQSDEGLVAEWHFDEGEGNIAKDSSGNGNDGTIYGATWVDGKFGKALNFDGKSNFFAIPSNIIIVPTFTFSAWVRPEQYNNWIFGFGPRVGCSPSTEYLGIDTDGRLKEFIGCASSTYSSYIIPQNSWTHIAVVQDSSWKLYIYINGELKNVPEDIRGSQSVSLSNDITMGAVWWGGSLTGWFKGDIDSVDIYNKALSHEEIKEKYEGKQTALSLTKTASPQSIKQGQTTTITLTVKNTGSTEISDIEIADVIPKDLTFIDGETTKTYASLSPKDSRQFQYSVQINEAGTFNLGQATASYADNKGNYQTINSKPASIEVIPSLITDSKQTPSRKSNGNVQSASVNLHGEKTDVVLGENVLLKLSAVNIIGNPTMHVQVIIIPPSGWSVSSSEFAKSGAGQYTTTYDLDSGGGKDIEVRIVPNQAGEDFQVEGRIIYYFGDDVATREDHTLNLPIKVRAVVNTQTPTPHPTTSGFGLVIAFSSVILVWYLRIRKWK